MKGYISVEIPTKKYIRAYLITQLGEKLLMNNDSLIGNKLIDLLEHKADEQGSRITCKHYDCMVKIYISKYTFTRRGANLNSTNVKNFNLFLQHQVKERIRFLLDLFIKQTDSFKKSLELVRREMGIEMDDWDCESIQKDYYRHRKRKKKPLLYKKTFAASVLFENSPVFIR